MALPRSHPIPSFTGQPMNWKCSVCPPQKIHQSVQCVCQHATLATCMALDVPTRPGGRRPLPTGTRDPGDSESNPLQALTREMDPLPQACASATSSLRILTSHMTTSPRHPSGKVSNSSALPHLRPWRLFPWRGNPHEINARDADRDLQDPDVPGLLCLHAGGRGRR